MPAPRAHFHALPSFALKPLAGCLLFLSLSAHAATHEVSNEAELVAAINAVNASVGANFIEFKGNITLSAALPPITGTVTIKGNGKTLSGDTDGDGTGDVQLLVVGSNSAPGTSILVQISGLTLEKGLAVGTDGTGGGDGANGTGGALQINSNADVVLRDVKIRESGAVGGNGDATDGNGGNALGGGIYVAPGGRLSLSGTPNPGGDPLAAVPNLGAGGLQGGQGQGTGTDGAEAGSGLFLDGSGNLRLSTNPNTVLRLDGSISDSAGAGIGAGTWNILLEGGGGAPTDTTDPTADLNFGTIVLGGTNTYSGDTYISDVNVGVSSMGALGSGGVVALDNGGLVVAAGVDIDRELVLASGGGRIGVYSGEAILSGDVTGTGDLMKVGEGDLALLGNSNFNGDWRVRQGALVLDDDSRLGSLPNLILDGGGLRFSDDVAGLRGFRLTTRGGYIDSDGHDAGLGGQITGWDGLTNVTLTFRDTTGGGSTTLADGFSNGSGHSHIESGTVVGNIATGNLTVDTGATYRLGAMDRQISGLFGDGLVETGLNRLTINLKYDPENDTAPSFAGSISGDGAVTIGNSLSTFVWVPAATELVDMSLFLSQELTGTNTHTGGTTVTSGALLRITDESSLGSGPLTLNNGALEVPAGNLTQDINLAGGVGILQTTGDVDFQGHLIGSADFLKVGIGTLTLNNASAGMTGDTVVMGGGSYVALADVGALGTGDLILSQGGGLRLLADTANLRPIQISSGVGVIDTGAFTVQSSGNITSGLGSMVMPARLRKEGSGDLVLTGSVTLNGGLEIAEGDVQLGTGGNTGSFSSTGICIPLPGSVCTPADISIASGARLVVNRSGTLTLSDPIVGEGQVVKTGSGLLNLTGSNSFTGGLVVQQGFVTGNSDAAYGGGNILLDGGGLQLASDLYRAVELGANHGSLQVTTGNTYRFGGQLLGAGDLTKTGAGTLIYTGVADQTGMLRVAEGTLQVGEGYVGTLLGNVDVATAAELVFGRDDLTQYQGVVSGGGDVIKRGIGELVLTGDHLFTGDLMVENGNVRLGYGGTTGSLAGGANLYAGAQLLVDHSGNTEISGSLSGSGTLRQVGVGQLRLPGDSSAFTGNTAVENGSLRVDGILGGDVNLSYGTSLQGVGSILGNLTLSDGARFTPGNSFGTFNIGGNLQMNSGSLLLIEIDELGSHDEVVVQGSAALAGTLRIMPQAGTYIAGCCNYTILRAAGGLNGTEFDQVSNDLAFLNTSVTYLADRVNVSFARSGSGFGSISSLTWNQQQVSNALDAIEAVDPVNPLVQLVTPLTTAEARAAYDSMSGDSLLAQANVAARVSRRFNHVLSARSSRLGLASRGGSPESMEKSLAAVRAGLMPEAPVAFASGLNPQHYDGPTSKVEGLWLEAAGFRLSEDSDSMIGSAASTLSGQLLALGVDGYWTDGFILGFGVGHLQADLGFDNRQSDGDVSGMYAGTYGRWESRSGWHYKGALAVGKQDTDQKRTVIVGGNTSTAMSSSGVTNVSLEFEAGIALHVGNYGMRPYAVADVQYLKRDAIEETGNGPANLVVDAATDVLGEFGVGVEFSRPWLTNGARWAQIQTGAALLLPFGDTQRAQTVRFNGTGSSYAVKATPDDSATLQLTLGGEWYFTPSLALWGGYEGRISGNSQEHNGVISVQYRW